MEKRVHCLIVWGTHVRCVVSNLEPLLCSIDAMDEDKYQGNYDGNDLTLGDINSTNWRSPKHLWRRGFLVNLNKINKKRTMKKEQDLISWLKESALHSWIFNCSQKKSRVTLIASFSDSNETNTFKLDTHQTRPSFLQEEQ